MISGIYDAKGKLIEGSMEREEIKNEPASKTESETSVLSDSPGGAYSPVNYQGNIIIKDTNSVISVFIGIK